ncbi:hypothetical protein U0070_001941, partial [Myodes glareolus]
FLREAPHSDNFGSTEAPTTVQKDGNLCSKPAALSTGYRHHESRGSLSTGRGTASADVHPINELSQNILQEWCHCHNLSTEGKKVEVYLRLQKNSYSKQKCHIPQTFLEAKMKPVLKKPKADIRGPRPQSLKRKRGGRQGKNCLRAAQPMAVNSQPLLLNVKAFLLPVTECRCTLVIPEYQTVLQEMIPLFPLPVCVFPSPGVEDNMLSSECIHSNRKMRRNFETNTLKGNTKHYLQICLFRLMSRFSETQLEYYHSYKTSLGVRLCLSMKRKRRRDTGKKEEKTEKRGQILVINLTSLENSGITGAITSDKIYLVPDSNALSTLFLTSAPPRGAWRAFPNGAIQPPILDAWRAFPMARSSRQSLRSARLISHKSQGPGSFAINLKLCAPNKRLKATSAPLISAETRDSASTLYSQRFLAGLALPLHQPSNATGESRERAGYSSNPGSCVCSLILGTVGEEGKSYCSQGWKEERQCLTWLGSSLYTVTFGSFSKILTLYKTLLLTEEQLLLQKFRCGFQKVKVKQTYTSGPIHLQFAVLHRTHSPRVSKLLGTVSGHVNKSSLMSNSCEEHGNLESLAVRPHGFPSLIYFSGHLRFLCSVDNIEARLPMHWEMGNKNIKRRLSINSRSRQSDKEISKLGLIERKMSTGRMKKALPFPPMGTSSPLEIRAPGKGRLTLQGMTTAARCLLPRNEVKRKRITISGRSDGAHAVDVDAADAADASVDDADAADASADAADAADASVDDADASVVAATADVDCLITLLDHFYSFEGNSGRLANLQLSKWAVDFFTLIRVALIDNSLLIAKNVIFRAKSLPPQNRKIEWKGSRGPSLKIQHRKADLCPQKLAAEGEQKRSQSPGSSAGG